MQLLYFRLKVYKNLYTINIIANIKFTVQLA